MDTQPDGLDNDDSQAFIGIGGDLGAQEWEEENTLLPAIAEKGTPQPPNNKIKMIKLKKLAVETP